MDESTKSNLEALGVPEWAIIFIQHYGFVGGWKTAMEALRQTALSHEQRECAFNKKEDTPSLFECSCCGWECYDTMNCTTIDYNYCPNCGRKIVRKEQ